MCLDYWIPAREKRKKKNVQTTSTNEIIYVSGLTKCNFLLAFKFIFKNTTEEKKIRNSRQKKSSWI